MLINNIITVSTQVAILFIIVFIGFFVNKLKIFSAGTIKEVTNFVLYIVVPCTVVNSYCREFDMHMLKLLLISIGAAAISFLIYGIIAGLIIKDKDENRQRVLRFGAVFSNAGFMAFPLLEAILGPIGLFFGAAYTSVFNIVVWTYGKILMGGNIKDITMRNVFVNPGVIGTVVGVIVFVCSVSLPPIIHEPIRYMASLNTPLPMLILGYQLANSKFNIRGLSVYISLFMKHFLMPALMIIGLYLCGVTGDVLVAMVISVSAPSATMTSMFAQKFNPSATSVAASYVSISMIISVITMPVMIGISMLL